MSWPKKNEEYRLYLERGKKSYLLMDVDNVTPSGNHEAIGEVLIENDPNKPTLCGTQVCPTHIYRKCKRVQWDEMPEVWQKALGEYLEDPKEYRGLWRIKK